MLKRSEPTANDVNTDGTGLVQVSDGPMRGLQAVILHETSDPDRVAVLLSILSCGAKLVIDRSQLEKVA